MVKEGGNKMTQEQHKKIHKNLHDSFDQLIADFFIHHRDKLPSNTTLMELMEWSYGQTQEPTDYDKK